MAKKSMIAREVKREKLVCKFETLRSQLKQKVVDMNLPADERWAAQQKLQSLPRDSSATRKRTRCFLTGRPRGVYKKFGLGRNKLRQAAMNGDIPGLRKASW